MLAASREERGEAMSPRVCWLVAALALPALLLGGHGAAQEGPSLSIDPSSQTVPPDLESFEVRILVDNVTTEEGLGGYTLALSYDPAVVHALEVTDSGLIEGGENVFLCPASAIDNDAGQLGHLCLTVVIIPEPGPQVEREEVLATVQFEPVGEGTTVLDIGQSSLINPQGDDLGPATVNGQVTVGSGGATEAPATPQGAGSTSPDGASDGGANVGIYIGLGVGVSVLAIAIGAAAVSWRRRRAR